MKATRLVWSGVLAVGVFAAAPVAVSAAPRVGITVVVNGGGGHDTRDAYRYGFERGRSEGAQRGYRSAGGDFPRDSWYRGGDRGYRGWMGPRSGYTAGYRQGYEAAYRRACAAARSGGRGYGYGGDGRGYGYGSDGRGRDSGYGDSGYERGDDRYRGDPREDWRR